MNGFFFSFIIAGIMVYLPTNEGKYAVNSDTLRDSFQYQERLCSDVADDKNTISRKSIPISQRKMKILLG